ncbi:MAG: DUF805 domain-containing protein [Candidatus Campbellbacteria bacterium]|nr:DUF805 domain-containing protein [Candidatus Campbellbacteria bacterium]
MKTLFLGKGRINRITFFVGILAVGLLGFLYTQSASGTYNYGSGDMIVLLPLLLLIYFTIRLCVLRLYDANQSPGWSILLIFPPIAPLVLLVLALLPGTKGANENGPRPSSGISISSRHQNN